VWIELKKLQRVAAYLIRIAANYANYANLAFSQANLPA